MKRSANAGSSDFFGQLVNAGEWVLSRELSVARPVGVDVVGVLEGDLAFLRRAAAESQVALGTLNEQLDRRWGVRLVNRTGIASGEIALTASSAGEQILVGDVGRLANKLEQSAPAMEVLLGESTYRMVASRITVAPAGVLMNVVP